MNKYQRLTLILGAVILVIALVTVPYVVEYKGFTLSYNPKLEIQRGIYAHIDYKLALIRGLGVIVTTGLVFTALKGLGK